MHVVQELDPHFQRTVGGAAKQSPAIPLVSRETCRFLGTPLAQDHWVRTQEPGYLEGPGITDAALVCGQVVVASKFDNRLKEFGERWEVDRYLSAAGYLHSSVKPFFVALPKVTVFLLAL